MGSGVKETAYISVKLPTGEHKVIETSPMVIDALKLVAVCEELTVGEVKFSRLGKGLLQVTISGKDI
jgi:hypothetical protein